MGGLGFAGGSPRVLQEMLGSEVEQSQDGVPYGVGYTAPGRVIDALRQLAYLADDFLSAFARGKLLEQFAHDVDTDPARPAAAAGLLLYQAQVLTGHVNHAGFAAQCHAPPGHHGFDALHIGLSKAVEDFLGPGTLVSLEEDRYGTLIRNCWRLGHSHRCLLDSDGGFRALMAADNLAWNLMISHRATRRPSGPRVFSP
jgi:hypothetical protein